MKKILSYISLGLGLVAVTYSVNADNNNCEHKRIAIEKKIAIAKEFDNTYEVIGLEKALAAISINCSTESLIADVKERVTKQQSNHAQKLIELTEVETELTAALAANNNNKIQQYEEKISEIQIELQEAQEVLESSEAELEALMLE